MRRVCSQDSGSTSRACVPRSGTWVPTILVVRNGGDITGCVALQSLEGHAWYLETPAVDPDRQIAGMGKAIMSGAERFAQARVRSRSR